MGTYRGWQKSFIEHLVNIDFKLSIPTVHSILIDFWMIPKPGRKPDVDNLIGGVFDTLVSANQITDDNWGILSRVYGSAHRSPDAGMIIYFTESKKEMLYVLDKFFD